MCGLDSVVEVNEIGCWCALFNCRIRCSSQIKVTLSDGWIGSKRRRKSWSRGESGDLKREQLCFHLLLHLLILTYDVGFQSFPPLLRQHELCCDFRSAQLQLKRTPMWLLHSRKPETALPHFFVRPVRKYFRVSNLTLTQYAILMSNEWPRSPHEFCFLVPEAPTFIVLTPTSFNSRSW